MTRTGRVLLIWTGLSFLIGQLIPQGFLLCLPICAYLIEDAAHAVGEFRTRRRAFKALYRYLEAADRERDPWA